MNYVILDPGFDHFSAHHHSVNLGIAKKIQTVNRQIKVFIFASAKLDVHKFSQMASLHGIYNTTTSAFFRTQCYPCGIDNPSNELVASISQNMETEIHYLFDSQPSVFSHSVVLAHTFYGPHLLGLSHALANFQNHSQFLLSVMFSPFEKSISDQTSSSYSTALENFSCISEKFPDKITVGCSSKAYKTYLKNFEGNLNICMHPSFSRDSLILAESNSNKSVKNYIILFLGSPKLDKGFLTALKYTELLITNNLLSSDFVYFFHYNNDFPGCPDVDDRINFIEDNGILVYRGQLSAQSYSDLINRSRIVCLPYEMDEYYNKTSGVLWDAMCSINRPQLIIAKGTLPQREYSLMLQNSQDTTASCAEDYVQTIAKITKSSKPLKRSSLSEYGNFISSSFVEWHMEHINSGNKYKPQSNSLNNSTDTYNPSSYHRFPALNFHLEKTCTGASDVPVLRILLFRSVYGHFSEISGPSGFIPYLRAKNFHIETVDCQLGINSENNQPLDFWLSYFKDIHMSSYQADALEQELDNISKNIFDYDVIHFLDSEHCGGLTAKILGKIERQYRPKIILSIHQPPSILKTLQANNHTINLADLILVYSADQKDYLINELSIRSDKIKIIHHGVSDTLYSTNKLSLRYSNDVDYQLVNSLLETQKVFLTVGSWLRDYDKLALIASQSLHNFIVVSKGLEHEILSTLPNVTVLNSGINDATLHYLYQNCTALVLPLHDAAANNAIIESCAFGMTIIAEDLPSIREYTAKSNAYYANSVAEFIRLIESFEEPLNSKKNTNCSDYRRWSNISKHYMLAYSEI